MIFGAVTDAAQGAMTANGFTVPAAGVYDISVGIVFYNAVAGDYINISVRKNYGEALKIAELTLGATGPYGATGAGALALAAGDVLSVWAQVSTGRTIYGAPGTEVTTFTVANWRP